MKQRKVCLERETAFPTRAFYPRVVNISSPSPHHPSYPVSRGKIKVRGRQRVSNVYLVSIDLEWLFSVAT